MKRLFYLSVVLIIFLSSCNSIPRASFVIDTIEPEVGQEVYFTNNSDKATRFEWDFGDGYISTLKHPSHIFNSTGSYEIVLTAISKNGQEDKASLTIDVLIPTLLEIEVQEYYDGYAVAGASVILYPTITDWDAQTGMISEGFTDNDGIAVFAGLDPYVHYVDVWEQDHDNYVLRDEDIAFVRTSEIIPHKINRFLALVDYVEHSKGDTDKRVREIVIKKLTRKASDRSQPGADGGTENWQDLYNRRVNK